MATRRRRARAVTRRPAEIGGVAGSLGLLIAYVLGTRDAETIVAIGSVIGAIPGAITWAVNLWRGA